MKPNVLSTMPVNFPTSITVISDEVSQELAVLIRFVKEFRLPGIELRSMFGRAFKDLTPADVAEIRRVARSEGWRIFGCASPVFKCDIDDAVAVRAHVDEFKRSVDIAGELGCDLVRVFTFLRRNDAENTALLPRVAEHVRQLQEIAAGTRVRIGIENEHSCIVASGDELVALLALLPDSRIGAVWDPCNVLCLPDTGDLIAAYGRFSDRVFHIHVKEVVRTAAKPGGLPVAPVPVGLGDVDWRSHLAAIERSGYRGMLSLETHWRVVAISEEKLHLPAGYEFSNGGEEASRTCLHNLRALMRRPSEVSA